MGHDGQRGGETEDAVEGLVAVDEHVTCRRAHEQLDAWHGVGVELGKEIGVVVGGAEEEGVVDVTLRSSQPLFVGERLEGGRLRLGVGHVEEGGHAASGCRTALCLDVGLVRQSGLAEVDVRVDDAGQDIAARGVDGANDGTAVGHGTGG